MTSKIALLFICTLLVSCKTLRCHPYFFDREHRPKDCFTLHYKYFALEAREYSVEGKSRSYLLFHEDDFGWDHEMTFFGYRNNKEKCEKQLKSSQKMLPKHNYRCVPLPYPDEVSGQVPR